MLSLQEDDSQKIFLIGGNDGKVTNTVDVLDLPAGTWTSRTPMLSKRDELAACIGPDEKIYVIGGYGGGDNSCLDTAERFDHASGKWEMIASLSVGRRALSVVALPDGIYAIGGYSGKQYLASVERYDIERNRWNLIAPMLSPRCTLAAVVAIPDFRYIYVIGGFNGKPLQTIERYDITSESWEEVIHSSLVTPRFMHAVAVLQM